MTRSRLPGILVFASLVLAAGCDRAGDPVRPDAPGDQITADLHDSIDRAVAPGDGGSCPTAHPGPGTLTVLSPPAPANAGRLWAGYESVTLQSTANNNGVVYQVEARWNLPNATPRGSWTWLVGGGSGAFFRESKTLASSVQDALVGDQIRTIDLRFLGDFGTRTFPRNGWVNISSVYADVLQWLVNNGIAEGVVGHVGSSGGSTLVAAALANQGCDRLLDGVVLGGGPWWIDLTQLCRNGVSAPKALIDQWTWQEVDGSTPCQRGRGANPSFDCMSIIGSNAVRSYPNTRIAVLIGTNDPNGTFFSSEANRWLSLIQAESESFERPATGHNVLSRRAGADRVLTLVRQITAAG